MGNKSVLFCITFGTLFLALQCAPRVKRQYPDNELDTTEDPAIPPTTVDYDDQLKDEEDYWSWWNNWGKKDDVTTEEPDYFETTTSDDVEPTGTSVELTTENDGHDTDDGQWWWWWHNQSSTPEHPTGGWESTTDQSVPEVSTPDVPELEPTSTVEAEDSQAL